MKALIVATLTFVVATTALAQETPPWLEPANQKPTFATPAPTPPPQQPVIKYNPFSNNFDTTTPNAQIQYNPHSNTFQHSEHSTPTYNPFSDRFEYPK